MNYSKIQWNKRNYQQLISLLKKQADPTYRDFHFRLLHNDMISLYGVRTPILKRIAKEISRGDYQGFLKYGTFNSYEEVLLRGLVITDLKLDLPTLFSYLADFIPHIDNWACCDIVCANAKFIKKDREEGLRFIQKLLKEKHPFTIRFAIVLLLNYYMEEPYLKKIFSIADMVECDDYYVKMALAWLLSYCYIKYPDETTSYLIKATIDPWIKKKTIQKICDSKQVSTYDKHNLKNIK